MTQNLMNRRSVLKSATAGLAMTAAPGLLRPAAAQSLTPVTYLTPFGYLIAFAETMFADTGGFFAQHGLDVTIQGGRGSAMAVQQVVARNALCSRTGGTDLIKAYAKDPNIVAFAEIYQRDLFYVISGQDDPIESPSDMIGSDIGIVSAGGATENILDMMLAGQDIASGEVNRQVVGNAPAAFELVQLGRIKAFIATSDTLFQLRVDEAPVSAFSTDEFARVPGQVYMTSRAQYEERQEDLTAFLRGVHDSLGAMLTMDDLGSVIESMESEYEIFEAGRPDKGLTVLANSLNNYKAPYDENLATKPDVWETSHDLMVKAGLIDPIENRNFFDDAVQAMAFQ